MNLNVMLIRKVTKLIRKDYIYMERLKELELQQKRMKIGTFKILKMSNYDRHFLIY